MSPMGDADNKEGQQPTSAKSSKTEQIPQPRRNQNRKVIPFTKGTALTVLKYWVDRITRSFRMYLSIGKKFIAVLLTEKHCEPMKSVGIAKMAQRHGYDGRFALG